MGRSRAAARAAGSSMERLAAGTHKQRAEVAPIVYIEVAGYPTPQGSKRAFVQHGRAMMTESSGDRLRSWRQDVKAAAIAVRPSTPLDAPLAVLIDFRFPRPKSHFRTGANAHLLRDAAPAYPANRATGDIEKLVRSTHDAITAAGVWTDDSLVALLSASKRYVADELAGASIQIEVAGQ